MSIELTLSVNSWQTQEAIFWNIHELVEAPMLGNFLSNVVWTSRVWVRLLYTRDYSTRTKRRSHRRLNLGNYLSSSSWCDEGRYLKSLVYNNRPNLWRPNNIREEIAKMPIGMLRHVRVYECFTKWLPTWMCQQG